MKTGNIAVVSPNILDFEGYVGKVYEKASLPKTRLKIGNKISITEKGVETVFVIVQHLHDVRGVFFRDAVFLFGCETLTEYDKICDELNLRVKK